MSGWTIHNRGYSLGPWRIISHNNSEVPVGFGTVAETNYPVHGCRTKSEAVERLGEITGVLFETLAEQLGSEQAAVSVLYAAMRDGRIGGQPEGNKDDQTP